MNIEQMKWTSMIMFSSWAYEDFIYPSHWAQDRHMKEWKNILVRFLSEKRKIYCYCLQYLTLIINLTVHIHYVYLASQILSMLQREWSPLSHQRQSQ